jgi:beta-N-acetylhexosaminidase
MDKLDHHRRMSRRRPDWPRRRSVAAATALVLIGLGVSACGAKPASWRAPSRPESKSSTAAARAGGSAPTVKPTKTAKPSAADACVTTTMAKMTLRQLVGQVMLVGTPTTGSRAAIEKLIRDDDIGGVFLSGRSVESASKLRAAISSLQSAAGAAGGPRLLISLDQEGGEVQALKGKDFPPIPTAVAQGKLSRSTLYAQTVSWSRRLAAIGVTLDLAPVSDTVPTSLGTKNPPIGAFRREYGSDPTKVAEDITTVVTAVQSTGVLTTLKHFPGLGRVKVNTDFSAHAIDHTTTAHDPYLAPFIAGIHSGTGAVMVSSATYPNLDPKTIATFSVPIVTGLLREKLGFNGLIVSDAMGGAKAVSFVPTGQRAVRFIKAGGDFALTAQSAKAPAMISGLLAAAHGSAAFTAQLKTAATYVMRSKYTAGLLACSPSRQ